MSEFLSQGGYAFYVWTSYGLSALALAGLAIWVVAEWRQAQARLKAADEEAP
jgi:heme exporter protein D